MSFLQKFWQELTRAMMDLVLFAAPKLHRRLVVQQMSGEAAKVISILPYLEQRKVEAAQEEARGQVIDIRRTPRRRVEKRLQQSPGAN